MKTLRNRPLSAALCIAALLANNALADSSYPSKPIRLVAPFAPGGAADTVARILAPTLSSALHQTIVVDNRAGAGGAVGSATVAAAPADGYTLLINLGPPHQTLHLFTKSLSYDPIKDFTAVAMIATAPQVLVVPTSSPYTNVKEFLEAAKKRPSGLTYATSGIGTSQHLAGLLLASSQKVKLTHVGYRGGSAALTDVLAGQTDAAILVMSTVLPYIRNGKLRALGVLQNTRVRSAPSIPTLAEAGVIGFSVPDTWVGILGPSKLAGPVVGRLYADVRKTLSDPGVRSQLEQAGYEPKSATPEEFARAIIDSEKLYRKIATEAGITKE